MNLLAALVIAAWAGGLTQVAATKKAGTFGATAIFVSSLALAVAELIVR